MGWSTAIAAGASLLGGAMSRKGAKEAANTQADAMRESAAIIAEQVEGARKEVKKLQEPAERNLLAGAQAAMGTLGQTYPEAARLAQQGNLGAQQALSQGMGQYQQALLGTGMPIAPAPFQLDYNMPEFTLPQFQSSASALGDQFAYIQTPEEYQAAQAQQPQEPYRGVPGNVNQPRFRLGGGFGQGDNPWDILPFNERDFRISDWRWS